METIKICISCGMPMKTPSEFAGGDTEKDYCVHCANPDGSMKSFEEQKASLTGFIIKTQGIDKDVAMQTAENMMKKLPAWREHFDMSRKIEKE